MQLSTKNITLTSRRSLQKILRFHYLISIGLLLAGVAFTLYYITSILNQPASTLGTSQPSGFSDKFDTATITKINKLKYRDEPSTTPQPAGRTNPFTE